MSRLCNGTIKGLNERHTDAPVSSGSIIQERNELLVEISNK
ncbi:hypothetical protein VSK92_06290 [Bacillus swezeyi]